VREIVCSLTEVKETRIVSIPGLMKHEQALEYEFNIDFCPPVGEGFCWQELSVLMIAPGSVALMSIVDEIDPVTNAV